MMFLGAIVGIILIGLSFRKGDQTGSFLGDILDLFR